MMTTHKHAHFLARPTFPRPMCVVQERRRDKHAMGNNAWTCHYYPTFARAVNVRRLQLLTVNIGSKAHLLSKKDCERLSDDSTQWQ